MLKWLVNNSGRICSVLGGLAIAGGFVTMGVLSVVTMPIPALIAAGSFIGACIVGAAISGACYLGREYGIQDARELQQAEKEIEKQTQLEQEKLIAENTAKNSKVLLFTQSKKEGEENAHYVKMQADITSLQKDVAILKGAQATRFQSEALRELHNERRLNAGQVDLSSDSGSDSEDANLLSQHSIFPPTNPRNRQPAANDSLGLGVELRHRNNPHK